MPTRYFYSVPHPEKLRAESRPFGFASDGAEGMAAELEQALRTRSLFERWQQTQEEPDEVDASLAATDPQASVRGKQSDLRIELVVTTSLPGSVLKHRLNLLAGPNWQLHDVSAA